MHKRLYGNKYNNSGDQKSTEIVRTSVRNAHTPQGEKRIKKYGYAYSDKAKFFSQNREDRVPLRLRQVAEFLNTLAESPAKYSAGAEGDGGLLNLIRRSSWIQARINKCLHPL